MRELLEEYSGIAADAVESHILHVVRWPRHAASMEAESFCRGTRRGRSTRSRAWAASVSST